MLSGLVLVVFLVFTVANMEQVWAVTFNPDPPVDGQPFTITSSGVPGSSLSVYGSCGCNGGCAITAGVSPFTLTLAAGQYNVFDSGGEVCTSFTVDPAPPAVGGTMLYMDRVQLLLPWITLIAILATISVWTLIRRRK